MTSGKLDRTKVDQADHRRSEAMDRGPTLIFQRLVRWSKSWSTPKPQVTATFWRVDQNLGPLRVKPQVRRGGPLVPPYGGGGAPPRPAHTTPLRGTA
jgi:hypothetical protein